jgi:hypothetical protein
MGHRRPDDIAVVNGQTTAFEGNTTPWNEMGIKKYNQKISQVGADMALREEGLIDRAIWFGTEPLPTGGLGGALRIALEEAGIEYWHVPWHP